MRGQPQIELVGDADDPHVSNAPFDVAVWDAVTFTPPHTAFRFIALLRDTNEAKSWLDAGASGIVLETSSAEELLDAIRQVARGETYLPPSVARQIVSTLATRTEQRELIEPLTERERQVLILLTQGLSNKDMAQKLYVSVRTVEGHLANIYGKLHVKSRTEAALWAVQNF